MCIYIYINNVYIYDYMTYFDLVCWIFLNHSRSPVLDVFSGTSPRTQSLNHQRLTGEPNASNDQVMTAAAKHLCPVTLELGGKSPVIVDRGLSPSQLHIACSRIISTALFVNAGQSLAGFFDLDGDWNDVRWPFFFKACCEMNGTGNGAMVLSWNQWLASSAPFCVTSHLE